MGTIGKLTGAFALFLLSIVVAAAEPEEREQLFDELRNAPSEPAARAVEEKIWQMWLEAGPTVDVRDGIKEAMRARGSWDLDRALDILDGVVAAAPDYPEGWNQRAFIHFLKEDYDESLADLDRALELEPKHFAALAGKALVLMRQGRMGLAQTALREAIAIDPWLKERHLIVPRPGEIIPEPGGTPL